MPNTSPTANTWAKVLEFILDKDEINKQLLHIKAIIPHRAVAVDCFWSMAEEEHLFSLSIASNQQAQLLHHLALVGGTIWNSNPWAFVQCHTHWKWHHPITGQPQVPSPKLAADCWCWRWIRPVQESRGTRQCTTSKHISRQVTEDI